MRVKIFDDYNTMSVAAADIIIDCIKNKPGALLCFATGNTPILTYKLLAEKVKQQQLDLSQCFCIGLDEWLGVPPHAKGSCYYDLHEHVFGPLGIKESQVHLFDGLTTDISNECKKMDQLISKHGDVDCLLAGIGVNGHIGFNEPGVDPTLKAHEQLLHATTLASGQNYFKQVTKLEKGITLGLAQVMSAKKFLLLANGKSKAEIINKAVNGEVSSEVPASCIQQCENGIVIIDKEAASALPK
jgi:glucosamine-6-phosphate isomerase